MFSQAALLRFYNSIAQRPLGRRRSLTIESLSPMYTQRKPVKNLSRRPPALHLRSTILTGRASGVVGEDRIPIRIPGIRIQPPPEVLSGRGV